MGITVIIPTLRIDDGLERLLSKLPDDTVIVNGGPETYSLGKYNIVNCNPGRGLQLATGAKFAKGDWLLFLHGDSTLTKGWYEQLTNHMKNHSDKAFVFKFKFDEDGFWARIIERFVQYRCRKYALPYGDQGLFISRKLYDEIGGYNEMPLMEDVDIIKRIGKDRLIISSHELITSSEKYSKYGYLFRMCRNGFCYFLYKMGVAPETIKKIY